MKRRGSKGSHLGYYNHHVVDGGKARVILNVSVTPFEVTENAPMLELLWRTSFRWKIRPERVTGGTAYGRHRRGQRRRGAGRHSRLRAPNRSR
jgi:hypothetical protein